MPNAGERHPTAGRMAAECIGGRLRALNRSVTALYDEALRPHGLRAGQLNLLAAISCLGAARPADLCEALRMEKSTLSRDADVMRRNGWLLVEGGAGRARPLRISPDGRALLERALPDWERAQEQARALIGDEGAAAVIAMSRKLRIHEAPGP